MSIDLARDPVAVVPRSIETERAGPDMLLAAARGASGGVAERAVEAVQGMQDNAVVGKSGHLGRKIAATSSSTGTAPIFLYPAEASLGDLGAVRKEGVATALSLSRATGEIAIIGDVARMFHAALAASTSAATSATARAADVPLLVPRPPEERPDGPGPTAPTSIRFALGDALAVA